MYTVLKRHGSQSYKKGKIYQGLSLQVYLPNQCVIPSYLPLHSCESITQHLQTGGPDKTNYGMGSTEASIIQIQIGSCPNHLFAWTLAVSIHLRWVIKRLILTCRRRDELSSLLLFFIVRRWINWHLTWKFTGKKKNALFKTWVNDFSD